MLCSPDTLVLGRGEDEAVLGKRRLICLPVQIINATERGEADGELSPTGDEKKGLNKRAHEANTAVDVNYAASTLNSTRRHPQIATVGGQLAPFRADAQRLPTTPTHTQALPLCRRRQSGQSRKRRKIKTSTTSQLNEGPSRC